MVLGSLSDLFWIPFGTLWGGVFDLVGVLGSLLDRPGPPNISFWPPTSRQKGLWSAKIDLLEPLNLVFEPLNLILDHFDRSKSCFGASG